MPGKKNNHRYKPLRPSASTSKVEQNRLHQYEDLAKKTLPADWNTAVLDYEAHQSSSDELPDFMMQQAARKGLHPLVKKSYHPALLASLSAMQEKIEKRVAIDFAAEEEALRTSFQHARKAGLGFLVPFTDPARLRTAHTPLTYAIGLSLPPQIIRSILELKPSLLDAPCFDAGFKTSPLGYLIGKAMINVIGEEYTSKVHQILVDFGCDIDEKDAFQVPITARGSETMGYTEISGRTLIDFANDKFHNRHPVIIKNDMWKYVQCGVPPPLKSKDLEKMFLNPRPSVKAASSNDD